MTPTGTRTDVSQSLVDSFAATYGFSFDPFQRRACEALAAGSSVLVAAPTGAGKTVVGEFAAWLALGRTGRTFYTTPIKALSNQKYADFVGLHGAANVGLLTGDNSLNGDAPIVVMTTEVLRNMIYEDSPGLDLLQYVVLDEVHYLQDRYRGAVWEEVLIHLPVDVQTASLSATVSNAEEFAEWLQTLRGETEVIIEEKRPVEIRHWYFVADELLPMFVKQPDGAVMPNPRCREFERRRRYSERPRRGGRRPAAGKRARIPRRYEVVDRLESEGMLPCIYFIFSRRGCDEAVKQCLYENIRLTSSDERKRIVEYVEDRVADLGPDELDVLGYSEWLAGLSHGIAAHHAGMIPPFKETVEELFKEGLVKAVFATETLSLGINMPARTVVIESLTKFTGEKHELMTAGEYTQLAGRAGRRGIDEVGHAVVLYQRFTQFDTITRLASARTYPLHSSFQPSYNMAVNLVRTYDRHDAEHLVNSSFAQFQADREVVALERTRERSEAYLASYHEKMACDRGDIQSYRALLQQVKRAGAGRSRSSSAILDAITSLRPGDVIDIAGGKKRGRYAVLEVGARSSERNPRVLAMSDQRTMVRFSPGDFRGPPVPVARVQLPDGFQVRDARARRHVARKLERLGVPVESDGGAGESGEVATLRRELETHPCHSCPDLGRHLHFADRAARLEKEIRSLERRINRRTGTLARRFEQVLSILEHEGYVKTWTLTEKGEVLTGIYNESDLLVVEALRAGLFDDLDAPELAAVCSTLVYETRGPETGDVVPQLPTAPSRHAWRRLLNLWREIHDEEESRGLDLTREPDPGFADRAHEWAAGAPLERVISADDPPGDFVRNVKQLVDLLRQLEPVGPSITIREAIAGLHRGVVAYSAVDL